MEPDQNVVEQVELAKKLINHPGRFDELKRDAQKLAKLVLELDTSLSMGGCYPQKWIVVTV